jgi:hypothetical protein
VADEKHTWWLGQRVYVAVTAAIGCFLGVSLATTAKADSLHKAYGEFATEAIALNPHYCPQTVNTDGWDATQQAWRRLFPGVTLVLCFLHSILGIQQRCRRNHALFKTITDKLWHLYHSLNLRQFGQRLRRLQEWTRTAELPEPIHQKLRTLGAKASQFKVAFAIPNAYRTSNQVDQLINYQDRILYGMQYFHGTQAAANQALRAMALLWNFHPYCRKWQLIAPYVASPFEDLNGFRYHDLWLRNLLIASSLNGRGGGLPAKHTFV